MNKHSLKEIIREQCFKIKSNYIWLPQMEWLDANEAFERKEVWSDTFNLQELELFAVDGYGDMYAWFEGGKFNEEIVFIDLESEFGGEFFAPNLAAAIFRRVLEFASGLYTEFCTDDKKASDSYICESKALKILTNCQFVFGNYFENNWNEILNEMIECGFNNQNCFINEDRVSLHELALLLRYPKIGKPIILRN